MPKLTDLLNNQSQAPQAVSESRSSTKLVDALDRMLPGKGTGLVGTGDEPWHGTISGYQNHKCRCDRCLAANIKAQRRHRANQGPQGGDGGPSDW